ncbi:MAG: hypothetical protein IJT60_02865 [Clostridia bacterium]|nr:hypothetical protein [Clostridia bacterium]
MKNRIIFRRLLLTVSLTLLMLLLLSVFTGCGDDVSGDRDSESESFSETAYDGPMISLVEDGQAVYQIVRADISSDELTNASIALKRAIESLTGATLKIGTDYVDRTGKAYFPEAEYEFLIGSTNRQETAGFLSTFPQNGYGVKIQGTKVIIVGTSDHLSAMACEWFVSHYLTIENAKPEIPAELEYFFPAATLYTYKLDEGKYDKYDMCATVVGLQGLYNREHDGEKIYLISGQINYTKQYLKEDWIGTFDQTPISGFTNLLEMVSPYLKAVVLWDPKIPATLNAATTIAGVEDAVIMTQDQYTKYKTSLSDQLKVITLIGKFDGTETGSVKNDVYRWMIREYLDTGKCSVTHVFSFEDSCFARESGNVRYLVPRDKAIFHKGFVYDLSIWQDEAPKDDLTQPLGTDYNTYLLILKSLSSQRDDDQLTEVDGFYNSKKYSDSGNDESFTSKYKPTHVEWEVVYTFTPYGCFWNPVTESACNRTVHKNYELAAPLKQNRPKEMIDLVDDEDHVYLLMIMGDYDAAGSFYTKFYDNWHDSARGDIPLAWAVNPNLLDDYPDLIESAYRNATANDYFVANGGAGWYNPSRVAEGKWPDYVAQHRKYFALTDMSIAADIWDYQAPSTTSTGFLAQYSPGGVGMLISNQLRRGTGTPLYQHIDSKTGLVMDPIYNYFDRLDEDECARSLVGGIKERLRPGHATFMMSRVVWVTPTYVITCVEKLKQLMPDKTITVVDPYTYFALLEESLSNK